MSSTVKLYQCRLCLSKTSTRVNIFGGDFPKMLEILTSIKVNENDGLPKFSCTKCARDVQQALTVKKRIIKAHKMLMEAINKKRHYMENRAVNDKKVSAHNQVVQKTVRPIVTPKKNFVAPVVPIPNESEENEKEEVAFVAVKTENEEISTHDEPLDVPEEIIDDKALQQIINKVQTDIQKTKTPTFNCETCNLTFAHKSSYSLHMLKHKKSNCHICGRLIRSDNIRKHIMLHSAGPSVCSLCGTTCKNIESLRGHIFYQHKNSAEQYVCEECGKSFRIKYKFLLHKKKEHIGIKTFHCDVCGKGFFTNGDLIGHKRMTHEKLRPHVCEYCGTGFSSNYALKTHKRQHTNEKPYICDYCDEGFRQRVSLRSHLKSKHGIEEAKEWFCKVCEKGFATNYALSIHERLHEVQKCEICSETFGSTEFLTNHLWEVHNVKKEVEPEPDAE